VKNEKLMIRKLGRRICMEKKLARRKMLRRKAAALAGVTIMAGASLHGIALPKASAAENPSTSPSTINEQTTQTDNNGIKKPFPDASAPNPSTKQDQRDTNRGNRDDRYTHEKWFDRGETFSHRMKWYNDSQHKIRIFINNASVVDIVKAAAPTLGFDVSNDTFTLVSSNGFESIVSVAHNGETYNITVNHLANGNWLVSSVNLIQ
jgi:hypothetical protein